MPVEELELPHDVTSAQTSLAPVLDIHPSFTVLCKSAVDINTDSEHFEH